VPGLRCARPDGAFYVLLDVRSSGLDSGAFARRLLDEARVAVTPGEAFGAAGAGHLRLSVAAADEELERAISRITTFMNRSRNEAT